MAIPGWNKLEQSNVAWAVKRLFKRLTGKERWLREDLRVDKLELGGWHVLSDPLSSDSIVYSLGVGDDVGFDREIIAQFDCQVFAFDPTPATAVWVSQQAMPANFRFYPWAVGAEDGVMLFYPLVRADGSISQTMYTLVAQDGSRAHAIEVPVYSLATIMKRLGHNSIDILKVDIEGAEFAVLDSALQMPVPPAQIVVEFHHRFAGIDKADSEAAIAALRDRGYRIFAISRTGREISFVFAEE